MASEARNTAANHIEEMKEKQKKLATLISKVKSDMKSLKNEAAETVEGIDRAVGDIVGIVEAQKEIQYTDVQDTENLEGQDLNAYVQNVEKIYNINQRVYGEFENLLSEKHDLTFYQCFNTLNKDYLELDNIPNELEYRPIDKFDSYTFVKGVISLIGKKFEIR